MLTFPVKGGGDFKGLPSGSYIAICDMVVFLGLQPGSGLYPDPKFQVYIRYQVPSERVEFEKDGKKQEGPCVIGQAFTASMHEKARVRKILESWRGRAFTDDEAAVFDVSTVLGKPCMLGIVEKDSKGKTYSNISSVGPMPKGIPAPKAEGKLIYYAPDDVSQFDFLPQWIKEKLENQVKPHEQNTTVTAAPAEAYDGPEYTDADLPENMLTDQDIPF
jgi:hypothetical protein